MTKQPTIPTNPQEEQVKGRVALWLDPDDLKYLASHCDCPPDAADDVRARCARIRFRASAALHKAGLTKAETDEEPGTS